MKIAVVVSRDWTDAARLNAVLDKLAEKHPKAVVLTDNTAPAARALDGRTFQATTTYLDDADRILVFGPLAGPALDKRNTGTPVAHYRPDGGLDVYDEALFVAELRSVLAAEEIDETHRPKGRRVFDLDAHLRRKREEERIERAFADVEEPAKPEPTAEPDAPTLFDAPAAAPSGPGAYGPRQAAEQKKAEGMKRVDENADEAWKAIADRTILVTGARLPEGFTGDDVWNIGHLPETRENRALGPRFTVAARAGLIEKTGDYRASTRSNMSPMTVWRLTPKGQAALAEQAAA